jgi:hypothetical protein
LSVLALLACTASLLLLATPLSASESPAARPESVLYYSLDPGTPTAARDVFQLPIFVLGEPAGSPANISETVQAWEDLSLLYLNETPGPFVNWSVPSWGPGRFDLRLVLAPSVVSSIESGQAILALNSSVVEGSTVYGAAGTVDGSVLSSSIVAGSWWSNWFGIPNPPPSTDPSSFSDVIGDLAWFGDSTAGRALYASMALGSALLYLLEARRVAHRRLFGGREPRRGGH